MNDEIDKIDIILYKSYESDVGIGKENYNFIMKFINKQQKEIERLKYDIDFLYGVIDELKEDGEHIPRID